MPERVTETGLSPNAARGLGLVHALGALRMGGAILHVGVHPDDEDMGMVALMARGRKVRTVYWSATRGEGGQNRRGREKREALGIVRTWESLRAREIDGGEALYGPFYDFGFSKTADDSFRRWGRAAVVREIVRSIRLVQPQIVVARWSGTARDGHGQHQAIGLATRDAFEQASDPGAHRDLGLAPWQPAKLYCSTGGDWQPGESGEPGLVEPEFEERGLLRLDAGEFDLHSGMTFQEIAATAFNEHRTQGMGFLPAPGPYLYYYDLLHTSVPSQGRETSFHDGLDPELTGLADQPGVDDPAGLRAPLAAVTERAAAAVAAFHPERPGDAGLALLEGIDVLRETIASLCGPVPDEPLRSALDAYLRRSLAAFERVAARCFGLRAECLLERAHVTPGATARATTRLWNGGTHEVSTGDIRVATPEGWSAEPVASAPPAPTDAAAAAVVRHDLTASPRYASPTPYWLRKTSRDPYVYRWPDEGPLSMPLDDPLVAATVDVEVAGRSLSLTVPAVHRRAFPGGWAELPLAVLPGVSVSPERRLEILAPPEEDLEFETAVVLRCAADDGESGALGLATPPGWKVDPVDVPFSFRRAGETRSARFKVRIPAGAPAGSDALRYLVLVGGELYGVELDPVRLGAGSGPADATSYVAEAFLARDATIDVHIVDVEFAKGRRYGYVPGMKEEIVPALARFGLDLTVLGHGELGFRDLGEFDTLVVGPNAYASPAVRDAAPQLLAFAEAGGTLVVQYQTYGYATPGLAPYPFSFNEPHDRVTQPDAAVTHLSPEHPVLTTPNPIRPVDWNGWLHDRGLYFMGSWDARYTPLLACNDPGEEPKHGGLVVAPYGRGTYAYAAYSFFRQIPGAVPGPMRLFANLLALGGADAGAPATKRAEPARRSRD